MELAGARIVPCLWFDRQGEEAARFYTDIFPGSRILHVGRFPEAGQEIHGQPAGSVMTVTFELAGHVLTALNGGPHFRFNEAISLQVLCDNQEEVDHYWDCLGEGGPQHARQCGWLKDRYGLSWQVVPKRLLELMASGEAPRVARMYAAMLQMKKLDVAALEQAYRGA